MKILHVITSLRTGGAEKLMVDLLPRLKENGHDVDLLLLDGTDTSFRHEAERAGIRIIDTGKGGCVYSPLKFIRMLPKLRGYDIVHTHNTAPQLFVAVASLFLSCIFCTTEHNTNNRRRGNRWLAKIDRWMYGRYDRVICISGKAEENLRAHLGKCRTDICTINNGVDIARYSSSAPSGVPESIAPGSRKIMMVAGFRWEKDQDTLIKAMAKLPETFHLFLVGDGVRRLECETLAKAKGVAGRVHFMGIRSDVPNLLHSADYIVMSSHFEGLSLSSVEGMSVGVPFLASDVDGLREVVSGAGVLFPHGDAERLAAEVMRLDGDRGYYLEVARRCRERAGEFDISKMVEGYSEVYRNTAAHGKKD